MDTLLNAAVSSKMDSFKEDMMGKKEDPQKTAQEKKKQSALAKEKADRVSPDILLFHLVRMPCSVVS